MIFQIKKGQMEVLGLAIVVVILFLAAIFVVRFVVLKNPADYRKDFISSEIASSTISTFLKTTAKECSQLTMTELLQDCAQGNGLICNNGQDSCRFVNSTASAIFDKTLNKWKLNYQFLAYVNVNSLLIKIGKSCKEQNLGQESKIFPIPIATGSMFVRLDICQ